MSSWMRFRIQKHGSIDAKVRTISEDAFRKAADGSPVANAFYLSRIALETPTLTNMKDGSRLLPGNDPECGNCGGAAIGFFVSGLAFD